jgi:UDP-2,3-diacylglucosamine pyrophosphatase LpxH
MKRVIISDLHIGSKYSKEKELLEFLNLIECDELILAGDIIDFIKVPSFTEQSGALFKILDNFKHKIIYIIGNHDISFKKMIGIQVYGIQFCAEYEFTSGGKKYRVEHGDKYEKGIVHWNFFMNLVSVVQNIVERWLNINLTEWFHKLPF